MMGFVRRRLSTPRKHGEGTSKAHAEHTIDALDRSMDRSGSSLDATCHGAPSPRAAADSSTVRVEEQFLEIIHSAEPRLEPQQQFVLAEQATAAEEAKRLSTEERRLAEERWQQQFVKLYVKSTQHRGDDGKRWYCGQQCGRSGYHDGPNRWCRIHGSFLDFVSVGKVLHDGPPVAEAGCSCTCSGQCGPADGCQCDACYFRTFPSEAPGAPEDADNWCLDALVESERADAAATQQIL